MARARLWLEVVIFYLWLSRGSTRSGSGRTGARDAHFFIRGLLTGAPDLVLARLGFFSSGALLPRAAELALARLGFEMAFSH